MGKKILTIILCATMMCSLSACSGGGESPEELYSSIKEELKTTEKLEDNYFAGLYDMKNLTSAKEKASAAIKKSDEDSYKESLTELAKQNKNLESFINKETKKVFNQPTDTNIKDKYPFAIQKIDENFTFEPIYKVSSKEPSSIDGSEPDTTDGKPYANLWVDQNSYDYLYKLKQTKTTEVKVKDKDGKIKKALVNTKINFKSTEEYDDMKHLNQRDMYLVSSKDNALLMLVPSYSGDDYYIPYKGYDVEYSKN